MGNDTGSQIARSISLSSNRSEVLDRRHEVMLLAFLITQITDVRVTSSGALVVG